MILVGELALWIALLMAAWSAGVSFAGGALRRRDLAASGRRAIYVACAALALATAGVVTALWRRDFSLAYVTLHTSLGLPQAFAVSALWSGAAGSMLVWALLLSVCGAMAIGVTAASDRELAPWLAGTVGTLLLFFLLVLCLQTNPYERLNWLAADGRGLDPRLRYPAMVLARPLLILGYVAESIVFAFAAAARVSGRPAVGTFGAVRWWARAGWLALTVGVLLGVQGAANNGAGVPWGWVSAAEAPVVAWVLATVLLHAARSTRRRAILENYYMPFTALAALVGLVGAYLMATRSGVLGGRELATSVSAGAWAGGGVVLVAAAGYLTSVRRGSAATGALAGDLPGAVPVGTIPGHLAHVGAVVVALALVGGRFATTHDVAFKTGQDARLADQFGHVWRFVSQGVSRYAAADHDVMAVTLDSWRDRTRVGLLASEQLVYRDATGDSVYAPVIHPGLRRSPFVDSYATLESVSGDLARVRVTFVPLGSWLWVGGGLFLLSGLAALWPRAAHPGSGDRDT